MNATNLGDPDQT
ncbi:unnamed protein product, partial [Rotaria sp. Silwood1]